MKWNVIDGFAPGLAKDGPGRWKAWLRARLSVSLEESPGDPVKSARHGVVVSHPAQPSKAIGEQLATWEDEGGRAVSEVKAIDSRAS